MGHSVTLSVRVDPMVDFHESLASAGGSAYALVPFQLIAPNTGKARPNQLYWVREELERHQRLRNL